MVEQSNNNLLENVYKFNAKELDTQTGYYYYGARYYDPGASIFLSVDPLAKEFPGWNPYHYVHNNPINLIDPTGMSAEQTGEGNPKKQPSLLESTFEGISSTLDEIVISAKKSGFSSEKISSDWEKNKEKSGYNHFKTWIKENITLSVSGRVNNAIGVVATAVESSPLKISSIGKTTGNFTLGIGTAIDTYGVYQYQKDSNHPHAVHPAKMGINLGVGIYGIRVNPIFGALYSGAEALHPNGFMGAWADDVNMKSEFRKQNGYPLIIQR